MKANMNLETKWEKIARVFSKNTQVVVNTQTLQCCTDGNVIYLPANADKFSAADQAIMEGLLDHEWGHIEQEVTLKAAGKATPLGIMRRLDARQRTFFNCIEDLRIERGLAQRYPGVATNLKTMNDFLINDTKNKFNANQSSPTLTVALGCGLRAQGYTTEWMPAEYNTIIDSLETEINQMNKVRTPEQVRDLAIKCVAKIAEFAAEQKQKQEADQAAQQDQQQPEAQPQEQDQDGPGAADPDAQNDEGTENDGDGAEDGDKDGEQGDGQGHGEEQQDEQDGQPDGQGGDEGQDGEAEGEQDGEGGAASDTDQPTQDDDGKSDSTMDQDSIPQATQDGADEKAGKLAEDIMNDQPRETDKADALKRQIERAATQVAKGNRSHIPSPRVLKRDRWEMKYTGTPSWELEAYQGIKNSVSSQITTLKTKLTTLLKIKTQSVRIGDQEEGAIDPSVLYTVKTGNRRVFQKRVDAQNLDVAISILVDQSGSMGGSRMIYARQSLVAMAEALAALNIPFEMAGFNCESAIKVDRWSPEFSLYNRWLPINYHLHKEFSGRFDASAKASIARMDGGGCNVDSECVMHAAQRLAKRAEARKVLVVLSDGKPNVQTGDNNIQYQATVDAIKKIAEAGIEVYGLGIMSDHVTKFYPDHDVIWNVEEMPKKLLGMLKRYLLG